MSDYIADRKGPACFRRGDIRVLDSSGRVLLTNRRSSRKMASLGLHATPTLDAMPLKSEGAVVPGILISDVSIVEHGTGKRSVIGCFDQFIFPQFPATYGRFWVTLWISNLVGTLSELNVTCRIQQVGTGHVIFSNSANLKFPAEQTFERSGVFGAALVVQGAVFPQPGTYTIVILLNDQEVGSRDFNVILPPQPKQLQEPT